MSEFVSTRSDASSAKASKASSVRSQFGEKPRGDSGLEEEAGLSVRKLPRSMTARFISDITAGSSRALSEEDRSEVPDSLVSPVLGPADSARLPRIVCNKFTLHLESAKLEPKLLEGPADDSQQDSSGSGAQESAPAEERAALGSLRRASVREQAARGSLQDGVSRPDRDPGPQLDVPDFRIESLGDISGPEESESITSLQEEVESRRSIDTNIDLEPILKSHASFMEFTERKRKESESPHKASLCEVSSSSRHKIHRLFD